MKTALVLFFVSILHSSFLYGDVQASTYQCRTPDINSWLEITLNSDGNHEAHLDFSQLIKDTGQRQLPLKYCLKCTDKAAGDTIVFENSTGGDRPWRIYSILFATGYVRAYLTISEPDQPELIIEFRCVKQVPGQFITFHM